MTGSNSELGAFVAGRRGYRDPLVTDVERALEAILMVADEPQSVVSLATVLGVPVPAVRQSIERLVADYDGTRRLTPRGFELREVG
jgi:segregation and condensation protein B